MRCHICDADSDTVVLEHGVFSPCAECQAVIFECLEDYPKIPDLEILEIIEEGFDEPDYLFGLGRTDDTGTCVHDGGTD